LNAVLFVFKFIMLVILMYISIFNPMILCMYFPFVHIFFYIFLLITALANYFYAFFKFYYHKILLGTDVVKVILYKGTSITCQTFTNVT
jgi:hypothetical protein